MPQPSVGYSVQGGTAAAPDELNDRNRWEPRNAWPHAARCDYFVGLQYPGEPPLQGMPRAVGFLNPATMPYTSSL